jgi:hypothetical protein
MMERIGFRIVLSVFLIGLGVVILLSNLNLVPWDITGMQWFWLLIFGGAGALFLAAFLSNRENWWAVIPGFTLLGLAVLVSNIIPRPYEELGGSLFLGMIGLSFLVIFAVRRDFWWAIIPGGVLATLAMVAAASSFMAGMTVGAFFFLGLGATFLLVYLIPTGHGRMTWAIWPASILGAMGVLMTLGMPNAGQYIAPIALIGFGGLLVFRALRSRAQ